MRGGKRLGCVQRPPPTAAPPAPRRRLPRSIQRRSLHRRSLLRLLFRRPLHLHLSRGRATRCERGRLAQQVCRISLRRRAAASPCDVSIEWPNLHGARRPGRLPEHIRSVRRCRRRHRRRTGRRWRRRTSAEEGPAAAPSEEAAARRLPPDRACPKVLARGVGGAAGSRPEQPQAREAVVQPRQLAPRS